MGCLVRRSTRTTTVLSILLLTTLPISVRWRLAGVVWVSLMSVSCLFRQHGAHARDVAANLAELAGVRKLLGGLLHAQPELGLEQAFEFLAEFGRILGAKFAGFHVNLLQAPM